MDKEHFEWKDEYSVNVRIIDEQHKKLIETIDKLFQSIMLQKEKEYLSEIFKELNEYINTHFSTEEKYFKDFNYEGAAVHTALHDNFREDTSKMEARINNTDFQVFELLFFLENWWINHILDVDKRYSKNFNEHGLN